MTKQNGHFSIGHFLDVTDEVMSKRNICGNGLDITGNSEWNRKRQMLSVVAHHQRPLAGFRLPFVADNVEVTEGVTIEINVHDLTFMCGKRNLGEALEFAIGAQYATLRTAHIQLHNGRTGNVGIVARPSRQRPFHRQLRRCR